MKETIIVKVIMTVGYIIFCFFGLTSLFGKSLEKNYPPKFHPWFAYWRYFKDKEKYIKAAKFGSALGIVVFGIGIIIMWCYT